jgi:hypothetical protein
MTILDDAARLAHLGLVLRMREATLAPVLAAAAIAGGPLLVGASAHGQRLTVVMPYRPDVLAAVAPGSPAAPATGPARLQLQLDGELMSVALATATSLSPDAAVTQLAPRAHRDAWFDLVDQLCSIADGRIVGSIRSLDGARLALELRYPQRDRETDFVLIEAIAQLATDLGVSAAQLRLFRRLHPEIGRGTEIALVTTCTAHAGVSPSLGIRYPIASWELALRLAQGLVFNDSEAKAVPTMLGQLAGALGSDHLQSVELVLGPHEPPDVIVWAQVGNAG